ncbi:hypothetical protein P886_3800 [Alteromonadaceae bacterium 2753L.S.0a.02]|nr:hypothetical protein P886_3800 [Alteromonadaceae bacterium 2753L.S.0a.02]
MDNKQTIETKKNRVTATTTLQELAPGVELTAMDLCNFQLVAKYAELRQQGVNVSLHIKHNEPAH